MSKRVSIVNIIYKQFSIKIKQVSSSSHFYVNFKSSSDVFSCLQHTPSRHSSDAEFSRPSSVTGVGEVMVGTLATEVKARGGSQPRPRHAAALTGVLYFGVYLNFKKCQLRRH